MNKEAELPKSIDFSHLPEALRAFKAREGRRHTHTGMDTHVRTHGLTQIQTKKGLRVKGWRPQQSQSRLKHCLGSQGFLLVAGRLI